MNFSLKELQDYINTTLSKIDIPSEPANLYDPINYTFSFGGKRLRPILTLVACEMFGGKKEEAINAALGLEIFHNFTLLHDDIMDKSPIRRGQPTVHVKWDPNIAILSGDTMFVIAYEQMVKTNSSCLAEVLDIFNQTAKEVCEGQQYDMDFETRGNISIPDYLNMIRLKTSVLLAASIKTGAVIAGAKKEDATNCYKFGENLGLAFQLMDDYLDVFADEEKFGKKTGNDIVTNKKTYLYLKAFENANEQQTIDLKEAFNIVDPEEKVKKIKKLYLELNVHIDSENAMNEHYRKAISYLDSISLDEEQKLTIKNLANMILKRDH